jgi:hypothetical protein
MPKNGGLGQARAQAAKIWEPEPLGPIEVYACVQESYIFLYGKNLLKESPCTVLKS